MLGIVIADSIVAKLGDDGGKIVERLGLPPISSDHLEHARIHVPDRSYTQLIRMQLRLIALALALGVAGAFTPARHVIHRRSPTPLRAAQNDDPTKGLPKPTTRSLTHARAHTRTRRTHTHVSRHRRTHTHVSRHQ